MLIAFSDLSTIGRWVPRVNNSFLRSDFAAYVDGALLPDQELEAARGGFLPSDTAMADISGRMKKASSAG